MEKSKNERSAEIFAEARLANFKAKKLLIEAEKEKNIEQKRKLLLQWEIEKLKCELKQKEFHNVQMYEI